MGSGRPRPSKPENLVDNEQKTSNMVIPGLIASDDARSFLFQKCGEGHTGVSGHYSVKMSFAS